MHPGALSPLHQKEEVRIILRHPCAMSRRKAGHRPMPEAVGAQCRQMHAVASLTPMLRQCCGGRLLLRGGTRHIRVVDPEQGGFVTPRRVESRTSEDATRAKDQDNVRAIVSDSGLSSNSVVMQMSLPFSAMIPVILFRMVMRPAISWTMREASSALAPSVWCLLRILPARPHSSPESS
jgi:hypothetical protein